LSGSLISLLLKLWLIPYFTTIDDDEMRERERMRLAEEETRKRIEVRLRERQDGEKQHLPRRSDVSEGDLTANKEGL